MRKFNSSKKAAILASVLGGCMFGGSALAANLLVTVPSDYGTSNMSVITGSRVTTRIDGPEKAVISSLNRDPGTYSFVLDGKSMFLLRQYTYSTTDLIPTRVISADTTWSDGETYPSGINTKGPNPHSVAGYNGYIYTGDYDFGTIGVVKYSDSVLTEDVSKSRNLMDDLNNYVGTSYASPGWVHGEGMVIKDGQLYVVVSVNPEGGYRPYDDSFILQYKIEADGSLTYVSYTTSARNPDSVKLNNYNNLLLHTGIGGYQYTGHGNVESKISIGNIVGGVLQKTPQDVVIPANVKGDGLDFRDMTVWPNGTAFILAYNLTGSGGGSSLKIYKTTVANLCSSDPADWETVIEGETEGGGDTGVGTGWFNKLFAEYQTKRIWGEFGDNIVVYTDGATKPTYTWSAYTLAGNSSYHTFNSVSLLSGDTVVGDKALLTSSREEGLTAPSVTTTKVVNINANSKKGDYFKHITGTSDDSATYSGVSNDNSTYTFDADKTINLNAVSWKTQADLTNNILAAIYAHDGNDITVNAGSNTLQLQSQSVVATPVGVYAGNGKNVTINAGTLNIITASATGGNSLNNAIMNDAGKDSASKITVNGDVNISMIGAYGGNGVAVQKTDRWGEASYASNVENSIAINGNLTIKGADSETWGIPLNEENVLSRFNNAGILTQVENSRVDVSGTADMDVYGNGITTNATGSTVSIGGGEINVPKGMSYSYYTLGAYQGTINVNTGRNGDVVGSNTVKLGGDIFALSTGTINVALTNGDSYLRGIVDNGGTVNMWLQNGASWINQENNTRYSQDNEDVGSNGASHITRLTGGSSGNEGVIFQKSDSKDITVDSYSGSTMVIYGHDSTNPSSILGGNFTVKAADSGSAITLRTDSDGIDTTSEETVSKVLDALANKLYYTAYTTGETNLDGTVQIAEGLTAASVTRSAGTVAYDSSTGQGKLGEIVPDKTETPDGDNADNNKEFLVDNATWKGNNSGDKVNLTLKNQATWEGSNTGSKMNVKATASTWKGDNKGADIHVTLNKSTWEGDNEGTDATVTLKNESTWKGDSSGDGLQLTVDDSGYEGNISGNNSSVTLNDNSSWSGASSGSNFTLNLQGDSIWQLKGDSVITSFNASTAAIALLSLTAAAGGGPTIDMTDSTAGNLSIQNYNGNATVVMAHAADDVTKVNGGNITIGTATSGSGITLLTDSSGIDLTNKYVINDALNAMANKLYYTGYKNGEKNLTGYAKIAEGLTSASISKFVGDIQYDSTTGQGSLDKSSVDYGKDWPSTQSKTAFTTQLSGDYTTDKEYRDAGVLPDTNNIYKFSKDATTITTADSSVTTAKDTTLELNQHDMTITSTSGDAIATTGGTLTVKDAGSLTLKGADAIDAANSKVVVNAASANLNGNVKAEGANSAVNVTTTGATAITGAVSASGTNANVTISGSNTTIGGGVSVSGSGAKAVVKSISKLEGDVTTDADASAELTFAEGASWTGDNDGNTTLSMSKGTWNGASSGKLNATLTNGTVWTGASTGAGSTISLDASTWNGANSGANSSVTLTNGASWSKDNTADGVTVSADKSTWSGANGGAKANITLTNGAAWSGANSGSNATVNLTNSSWNGDNSGAGLSLTAAGSSWTGSTSAGGSATLTNGSTWTGASTGEGFSLSLNGSTWNNTSASRLTSFAGTSGVVNMDSAASVTIGSYSGDATVIYKHNSSNPTEVYGGNFTVGKAESGSKITLLTDNTGVDTTDEDRINEALDALANKLYYTAYTTGETNLAGTVKIAEGLTAVSVAKQTADIVYDKTTGQGSADHKSVTPGPVYPDSQDRTAFVTSITGDHETDKEYRKAGVLSQSVDNNIYKFTKDATTITTTGSSVTTAKDTTLELNQHDMTITSTSGDAIATTGGTLTVKDAGSLTLKGADAIDATNSKVVVNATTTDLNGNVKAEGASSAVSVTTTGATTIGGNLTANGEKSSATINAQSSNITGDVSATGNNSVVSVTTTGATAITGAVSASGTNANVTINGSNTTIGDGVSVSGSGAKVVAKSISKLEGDVTTDADASAELTFAEGAAWTGDNAGSTSLSMSKGTWNGASSGKLNATLTNGTVWTGASTGAGSTISLDASTWNGANSGANSSVTLTNSASWSKDNTADGVTVSADKSTWSGANGGAKANITLTNGAAWSGANSGSNATVNLTNSSWTGDNSGTGLSLNAAGSTWTGSTSVGGSATLTNGSTWTGASTGDGFSLSLNGSTWNNTGTSKLASFAGTSGVVNMDSAASVTIGSYSGDATVIYKHNSSNPTEVYGGNFTVGKAESGSKITLLTDNTGVDTTDEDRINEALDALANKLYYTAYTTGETNLAGTVKIAEGLTAVSAAKQTADIVYDKTTGQGSADHKSVTPGPVYPDSQDRTAFVTSITGDHETDKEYRKAGVLSQSVDNNIYKFTKDATTITTTGSSVTTAKDTMLELNKHDMTITSTSGDAIATTGGTLTVKDAGSLTLQGADAIDAANSKVVVNAASANLNGNVKAEGASSAVNVTTTGATAITGAVSASGSNANVTISGSNTTIGDGVSVSGSGAKAVVKSISKLEGDVTTDADASAELTFAEGAAWTGDNAGSTTLSMSKGTWNGASSGKLNATLTNGTVWTGASTGAGSTISLDASTWNGANSGANSSVTLTNGASWSKDNTADGVTVSADKSTWSGANGGAKANITLTNGAAWSGANSGSNATVNMTNSSWTGDNSGTGLSLTAAGSTWTGSTSAGGSATLTNGSTWTGASTGDGFSLSLNGSTWNNTGASRLTSFAGTSGVVNMDSAASVSIGSYSGDATVIYKHNSSNPTEVYGGNFTIGKAASGSKITLLTDNTGVDTTDEDRINEALDALANKLYYTAYTTGETNLAGTVKIAEGLTAVSAAKQTADIVYDKTTGQGSADHKSVTPGPVYPDSQDRTAFVTSITGDHETDKEYRKAGVLSQSVDNNTYKFTKDATTITTADSSVTTAKDTTLELNQHDMTITSTSGDAIATTGGTLTVKDAGSLTLKGADAIDAANSKVVVNAASANLNGNVKAEGASSVVNVTTTGATAITGAVSASGTNANVTINGSNTTIGDGVSVSGSGAKVVAKSISKLEGDVTTDADASAELTFAEGASWTGDNDGNTTLSMSKGTWNGASSGKLNATLTNGTVWTGASTGAGSTISLDASTWNGANSGANSSVTLTNGASWSKDNTADGVTVSADKSTWSGANGGAKANITLTNGAAWSGANSGSNATVNLTNSSWTGDNSGTGLSLNAAGSTWTGSTSVGGSATLTNGSTWTGASTGDGFSLSLNGSTWNNTGASRLTSFAGTSGVVNMDSAASVTIGSYSGDATVIYKHNSSNPTEVYGGNFTVGKAEAGSKITLLTDRNGVDLTDEDSIADALNALANKLYYTGYTTGERNLAGYVKLAEGLTASSVIKQTGDITYDSSTGQGSLKDGSVTPNVEYPDKQTAESFTTRITGVWKQDKEYKLAGVLHVDNATYDFTKGTTTITTDGTSIGAGKDLLLQMNSNSMKLKSSADAVVADKITIEFNDLNKLDIDAAGKALLAENGGRIILHNNGVVSTDSAVAANGAGSSIKTDGLTNITVSGGDAVLADAGSVDLAGGTITGDIHADNKGTVNVNSANAAAGDKLAVITGDINAAGGSTINIGLGTADSKLTGNATTSDTAEINIYAANGSWTGNAAGDGVSLSLGSKASWNNSGNSKLKSLKGSGTINQTDANAGNINVGSYSGDITVNYKHTADKDAETGALSNIKFSGGDLSIDKAEKGSKITLRTDNSDELSYSETEKIEQLFRELSKKLYYADAGINPDNLSGRVEIAEGLTKVKVYGDIGYDTQGQGNYTDGSIKRTDPEIVYGSSETAMMRGAKSAMASTALLWRSETSDMLQRMGDVRLAREESGLWAHYYGGKSSFDAKNTKYSTSYNAYQLGYDKQLDNGLLFGAAVSYDKGKNTYEMGGHGDGKSVSLAVYGSWNGEKGHYADVVVKGGQLDNDYTVYNDMGHKLEGDYDTWGLSLSAEYGRRMQLQNGFYFDPSVQFTVGRVAGTDYSAASDFLDSKGLNKYMHVSQDAFTTVIGRIGLGVGKATEKSMFYTKLAWAHEFSGDFTTTFSAENEPTSGTQVDFGGSWFEWQLGGSMKMNDNSYVYATFEKKFGGDTGSNDWRLDAGLRWSF